MHLKLLAAASALSLLTAAMPAAATSMTIQNTTWVEAYNGSGPTPWFSGSSWGADVGAPTYQTTQLVVSVPAANTMDFQFTTGFNGNDTTYDTPSYGNVVVHYADIFINPVLSANPPSSYGYAIVLGDQGANGGLSVAGLYQVTSDKTSQAIWSSRTQFIYGGAYAPANVGDTGPLLTEAESAPTVVTSGVPLPDWTVTTNYSDGILDVDLSTTNSAQFEQLLSNYDLFWGTGDCDNAPFFAAIDAPNQVPEPASFVLLSTALSALVLSNRRSRRRVRLSDRRRRS